MTLPPCYTRSYRGTFKESKWHWIEDHTKIDRSDLKIIDAFVNLLLWSDLINICLSEVRIFGLFLISYIRIGVPNHDIWRVYINVEKTQLATPSHKWDSNHFPWNLLLYGYIYLRIVNNNLWLNFGYFSWFESLIVLRIASIWYSWELISNT